jgi:hypothetical protein
MVFMPWHVRRPHAVAKPSTPALRLQRPET